MSEKRKIGIFKIVMTMIACILIIGLIIYLFPVIKDISTNEGRIAFKDKIDKLGIGGVFVLLGLQLAQIVLFFIPGEPIELLAGMCYGGLWGTVFVMLSNIIISAGIFFLVRKLGKRFAYHFCDEEKITKIENSKIFQNPKKVEWVMLILFFIPGTPKDLLVYIAGLLPLKPIRFLCIANLARIPSIISSTIAGGYFIAGDWKMGVIVYVLTLGIVGIFVLIFNKFDKNNITNEAINTVK